MKQFVCGMFAAFLLVALLAASDGGFSVVWEMEMKRPEAQRAVSNYIQGHCTADLWNQERQTLKRSMEANDQSVTELHLQCWADSPAK
jgi:hypothetical protein